MKKLLALILCVMMFVAVIPTSAFAAANLSENVYGTIEKDATTTGKLLKERIYLDHISDMLDDAHDNIEAAYKVLMGNQVVYGAAKGMDDTIVGLVDALAKGLLGEDVVVYNAAGNRFVINFNEDDATAVKNSVRKYVDKAVAAEILKNNSKRYDDGDLDPMKNAQVIANAISKVLTDKDFIAGYQAVATFFATNKLISDVNDDLEDLYDDFRESVDTEFDAAFNERYPDLYQKYIDTFEYYDTLTPAQKAAHTEIPWADEAFAALIVPDDLPRS